MPVHTNEHQEIEATLVICSTEPEAVAMRIAALTEVAGCCLHVRRTRVFRDRYVDSEGFALARAGWGLRLREYDEGLLVALKGPAQPTDWGGLARSEIEGPWGPETWDEIGHLLEGLGFAAQASAFSRGDPLQTLAELGLRIMQHRRTVRHVRDVELCEAPDKPLAELVVDTVTYEFQDLAVLHREVELEAKADAPSSLLRSMVEELLIRFHTHLRGWEHNKLATGLALGHLLAQGELPTLINSAGHLTPQAYDRLTDLFTSGWRCEGAELFSR